MSEGGCVNLGFCTILSELSQMSSVVSKQLSTARAHRRRIEALVTTVSELHDQLQAVKQRVDSAIYLTSRFQPNLVSNTMTLQQVMYLRYLFFNITLNIHTTMKSPSAYPALNHTTDTLLLSQAQKSVQIVVDTCCSAIKSTEYIHLDAGMAHTYDMLSLMWRIRG